VVLKFEWRIGIFFSVAITFFIRIILFFVAMPVTFLAGQVNTLTSWKNFSKWDIIWKQNIP